MAGAYAQEFEKWLQGSKNVQTYEDEDSVDMDDSNDAVDNRQIKNASIEHGELAPDLHNENSRSGQNSSIKNHLPDEPPILEPVRYVSKISDVSFSSSFILEGRNCSISQNLPEKVIDDNFKNSLKNIESEECFDSKTEKSENIFDKFTVLSDADDFPPPLIPSHEAHLTTVDAKDEDSPTEKSYATLQNLSPNFCAMEADSTSEMMKADQKDRKDRLGKAPVGNDIGMECDSTCMLGVSPHVISPGSNFESDNPNTPFNADISAGENPPTSWNSFSRETYTSLMPFSEHTQIDYSNNFLAADDVNSVGVYRHDSVEWDRECPKLEAVGESNGTILNLHNVDTEDPHEPPVLTVVPPPSLLKPKMAARRKRHTIDSVESISSKHKSISKDFCSSKSMHIGPSFTKAPGMRGNKKDGQSCLVSKKRDITHFSKPPQPKRKRERCKTLPIVDLISYSSHLPKNLLDFVVNSSQLSALQKRMHKLVSLLFPKLEPELKLMSPESCQFETLLKDLIHYLKEPDIASSTKCDFSDSDPPSANDIYVSDSNGNNLKPCSKDPKVCNIHSTNSPSAAPAFKMSTKQGVDEMSRCSPFTENDPCCSKDLLQHSNAKNFSNHHHPNKDKADTVSGAIKYNSLIPELSQLSFNKESERVVKNQPYVLIHKNPSALHKNFCKLSCRTLQLLLPDLNVSLTKEFSESPKDLLHFIDSVIALNSCVG